MSCLMIPNLYESLEPIRLLSSVLIFKVVAQLSNSYPKLANNPKLNIVGGIYTKSDASGDIHKFCVNLQKVLVEKYFANIELNTLVTNISKSNDKIIVTIKNDDNENDMSFDNVVVCAGVNTQTFADNLGDSMNIYTVKGYSVTIDLKDEQSKRYAPIISLIDQPLKIVSSRLGNKLRIAGTAEISGYDPKVNICLLYTSDAADE